MKNNCKLCEKVDKKIIIAPKRNISKLLIELTRNCNMKCIHCCNYGDTYQYKMTFDEYEYTVKSYFSSMKIEEIILSGGEIFTVPEIIKILDFTGKFFSHSNIKILTNGTIFNQEILRILIKWNITVQITLNGHNNLIDAKIRGTGFNKTIQTIETLISNLNKDRVIVASVINKINIDYIEDFVLFLEELNVRNVQFTYVYNVGRARDNWENVGLTLLEKRDALIKLSAISRKYFGRINIHTSGMHHFLSEIQINGVNNFNCKLLTEEFVVDTKKNGVYCYRIDNYLRCHNLDFPHFSDYLNTTNPVQVEFLVKDECENCENKKGCILGCIG
jgi:MoaA/NifB/PqqE/SkfB family radical SAM enzyme